MIQIVIEIAKIDRYHFRQKNRMSNVMIFITNSLILIEIDLFTKTFT